MNKQLELTPEQLQQHPEITLLILLLFGIIAALGFGGITVWAFGITRVIKGQPLIAVQPWRPRSWGFLDLILVMLTVLLAQIAIGLTAHQAGWLKKDVSAESDLPLGIMSAAAGSQIVVMLIAMLWLRVRFRADAAHMGFGANGLIRNIGIGLAAAAASLPVVYAIMAASTLMLDKEYDHPLLTKMIESGSFTAFLLGYFCAAVAAPLTEEFAFRVLLQGWLQSISRQLRGARWLIGDYKDYATMAIVDGSVSSTSLFNASQSEALAHVNPYQPSAASAVVGSAAVPIIASDAAQQDLSASPSESSDAAQVPPLWPVFVSGTLFGLAHYSYGVSFIPLIFLGIVLGYLYRATHSIVPSLVVHFTLNSIAMLGLALQMLIEAAK